MIKIIKTTMQKTVTKTVTYKTDKFDIIETIINDVFDNIRLICDDKDLTPMMLNLPDWNEYESFYDLLDQGIKIKSLDDIDLSKIYLAYTSGHILFGLNKKPVSIPYLFNYMGSLRERYKGDKIYEKLINLLSGHDFVMELKTQKIPYYNADFLCQKGVSFKVLLSQEKYQKLYDKHKNKRHLSTGMKHEAQMSFVTDIYGNEIKDLLEEYYKN